MKDSSFDKWFWAVWGVVLILYFAQDFYLETLKETQKIEQECEVKDD